MKKIISIIALIIMMATVVSADDFNFNYVKATLLNQDPDPAMPGEYVDLRWKVEKFGNERAEDIVFRLQPAYPFSFDATSSSEKSIGNWILYSEDEEYYTLHYKLRVDEEALEGTYEVELFVEAKSGISSGSLGKFEVRVDDKPRPSLVIGSLQTSPTKLVADTDSAKIDVVFENIGDGGAENVVVTIGYPDGFSPSYSYADQVNLGTIAAGETATATFYVDVAEGLPGKEYEASLSARYKESDDEDNQLKNMVLPLMIPLMDKPSFGISSSVTSPASIAAGDTVTLRLSVTNTGGKEAESVSVRAFKDSSQPFDFDEKSDFIGSLDAGESGEALIVFTVDADAQSKNYKLDLEVRSVYEDDVLIESESVVITVNHAEKGITGNAVGTKGSPLIGAAIIALVAIVAVGGYLVGKKKGAKKK